MRYLFSPGERAKRLNRMARQSWVSFALEMLLRIGGSIGAVAVGVWLTSLFPGATVWILLATLGTVLVLSHGLVQR